MSWNYRIVRRQGEPPYEDYTYFGVVEVYYDENGEPMSWTKDDMAPVADNASEMREVLQMMLSACDKPALEVSESGLTELAAPPAARSSA
jgi:hypothetical protein